MDLADLPRGIPKKGKLVVEIWPAKLYNIFGSDPIFHHQEAEKMSIKRLLQVVLILVVLFSSLAFTRGVSATGYCGSTYVVQRGDWLAKIAGNCGITLSSLYAANPWVRYNTYIYPGQVLVIPGGIDYGNYNYYYYDSYFYCGPAHSAYYGNYYIVCRGDTLSRIALYFGESVGYLQWRNGIPNRNVIYAGQFIWP